VTDDPPLPTDPVAAAFARVAQHAAAQRRGTRGIRWLQVACYSLLAFAGVLALVLAIYASLRPVMSP
jgi:hypothetical protein